MRLSDRKREAIREAAQDFAWRAEGEDVVRYFGLVESHIKARRS